MAFRTSSVAVVAVIGWTSLAALAALERGAAAQSAPVDMKPPSDKEQSAGLKIPITLKAGNEVLDDEMPRSMLPRPPSIEEPIDPDGYVCGPGDVFEIEFWGSQNLHLTLTTDLEGRAFIAKVGFVKIAGSTLSAVRTAVTAKLRTVYPGLHFDLTLASPRSFVVHVAANVKQPGSYTSRALDRVSSVVGRAGIAGSRRRIEIRHRDGTTGTADLVRYELTGDVRYNPFLLDGDVISVPFATPMVAIGGPVRRPGRYELVGAKDIKELLELAGGFTTDLDRNQPVQLLRKNAHQQLATTALPFTGETPPNLALHDDDQILFHSSDELQRTVLIIGAVVGADPLDQTTTSRRIPFIEGDTVRSLIDRVGGIKAPGDLRHSYISRLRADQPPELMPIDLEALTVRRDFRADRPIQMNDTIVVPPMNYSVVVEGAVLHAGAYNYNPTFGITEYIARAGGRSRTAQDIDDVRVIDAAGKTHAFRPDLRPAPGDSILVPERSFSRSEIAQLVLAGAGLVVSGIAVTIAATR